MLCFCLARGEGQDFRKDNTPKMPQPPPPNKKRTFPYTGGDEYYFGLKWTTGCMLTRSSQSSGKFQQQLRKSSGRQANRAPCRHSLLILKCILSTYRLHIIKVSNGVLNLTNNPRYKVRYSQGVLEHVGYGCHENHCTRGTAKKKCPTQ